MPRASLLIDSCEVVVTMDDAGTEIAGGSVLIEDGVITWVGTGPPPRPAGQVLGGSGLVALPGLVNTHHHLYQSLTRARAQDQGLFGWLQALYPVWADLDEEWVRAAAAVGLAELALSGCATTTDHPYIFPRGGAGLLEAEVDVARQIGLRFHPCRGAMDLGRSRGGLPPDDLVEDTDAILARTEDAVRRFHDPRPGAMVRVAVAPCSPFSVTPRLMRESASLARRRGVRLHTHIAETRDEEAYCRQVFGVRPVELLDEWGWLGTDVWLAHCVHLDEGDVARIGRTGTGVAWCPTSNLRLGSGIAPARRLLDAGAPVGLAVDGSASNDSGHLLAEARQALLVSRAGGDPAALGARDVLRLATRGGARCLGRDDIGALVPGMRGDVALFSVHALALAGADADPVAALVLCFPQRVTHLVVDGRVVVRDGRLQTADEEAIAAGARRVSRRIARAGRAGGGQGE
ncbi:MAG: 8-oxoguanine deaminase [Armatimonadota bacterium]|nr:8-oxoguanine deaminase [Armatimonadota bacterium]MDR7516563.1 8-oxoguanine deaminase [Armatimonadota bacterium]MDR7560926.1 8-oxoguanine deaminase [Armatimonadota bacterium]MDR7586868.1 8-oxoguanine deaminase [Armatimonadota bacterium]